MTMKPCATSGCDNLSAFATRTNPGWCEDCIDRITVAGGVMPVEAFVKKAHYRLTMCLRCEVQAHYKLDTILDYNARDEEVCRACYWRRWGREALAVGAVVSLAEIPVSTARNHADAHGYDYLGPLSDPPTHDGPHHVRCRACGRQTAQRLGDIAWGCHCVRNGKSSGTSTKRASATRRNVELFRDSGADAIAWWDHDRNDPVDWATAPVSARRTAHWVCPTCEHQFTEKVYDMHRQPVCPPCEAQRRTAWSAEYQRLKGVAIAADPALLAAWADEEDPTQVMIVGSSRMYRFKCPNGHHPRLSPYTFRDSGCPHCRAAETKKSGGTPRLAEHSPEIAAQWHPDKNGRKSPDAVTHSSKHVVWWIDPHCGYEWQAAVRDRDKYQRLRCPQCETVLDSLGYQYPTLAGEWSPNNPRTAWHVRPTSSTLPFTPEWACADNPEHTWTATLASRSAGAGCPECKLAGKSKVEFAHHEAATEIFGHAKSGQILRDPAFTGRPSWSIDISTILDDGTLLAIEYDGSYWHAGKTDVDQVKSRDLLAAGHRVVRLREHPLPSLDIANDRYLELTVHATAPDPHAVIARVADWVRTTP